MHTDIQGDPNACEYPPGAAQDAQHGGRGRSPYPV